jgi:hypothetical protein
VDAMLRIERHEDLYIVLTSRGTGRVQTGDNSGTNDRYVVVQ